MDIKKCLMADLKTAMKNKDSLLKSVITMLRAEIKQIEVDKRIELSDEDVIDIIAKQIKSKQSAIEDFRSGDREDLAEEALAEIDLLMKYLPEQLSQEELESIIKAVVEEVGATTMKDMGKVMGIVNPKVKGKADGKTVSTIVKSLLN